MDAGISKRGTRLGSFVEPSSLGISTIGQPDGFLLPSNEFAKSPFRAYPDFRPQYTPDKAAPEVVHLYCRYGVGILPSQYGGSDDTSSCGDGAASMCRIKMKTECSNCGESARVRREDYLWKDVDLPVTLHNVEVIRCPHCANVDVVIPRINQLMRMLALAVVSKPYRLRGEEVRFLRKYLDMTGDQFAGILNIDRTNLSKWENNADPVGVQSDRLIRLVVLSLDRPLRDEAARLIRKVFSEIGDEPAKIGIEMDAETAEYHYA